MPNRRVAPVFRGFEGPDRRPFNRSLLKGLLPMLRSMQVADRILNPAVDLLAALPKLGRKLSRLVSENGSHSTPADLADHVRQVLDNFGPTRVVRGSFCPVVNLASNYVGCYAQSRKLASGFIRSPNRRSSFVARSKPSRD